MMKAISAIILAVSLFAPLRGLGGAGDYGDAAAANARAKKGSGLIVCSPRGLKPGTVTPEEAAKTAKKGDVIRLLSGFYNPIELIPFNDDELTIEGDGSGGYVDLPVILTGRDCVVRNLRARSIEGEDVVIVDSIAHHFVVTSARGGKSVIKNCAMNFLSLYPNQQEVYLRNCSIVEGIEVSDVGSAVQNWTYGTSISSVYSVIALGEMPKKGKLDIQRCMISSMGHLFSRESKTLELTVKDNLIFVAHSLVAVPPDKAQVRSFEALDSSFNMKGRDGNLTSKPALKASFSKYWHWDLNKDLFILAPESPGYGKGYGCNMSGKGIPVPEEPSKG